YATDYARACVEANMEPLLAENERMKKMALMQAARASAAERETEALRAKVERLCRQLRQAHKDYGCELRDPNGTIWEYAATQRDRADRLAEALQLGLAIAEDGGTWSELGRRESARFKDLARAALEQEEGR